MAVAIPAIAAAIPALIALGKELFPPAGASGGDVTAAGAKKMVDMQKAASAYGAYRPDQADARMKGLNHQLSAFQGAGNMMQAMYGGSGVPPAGGGYTPGKGGFDPNDRDGLAGRMPSPNPADMDPYAKYGGKVNYDAYMAYLRNQSAQKTANGGIPANPGGLPATPIITDDWIRGGGIAPGSSGTSLVGPMGQPPELMSNPMTQALAMSSRKPVV